jgi:hypothetical protein
MGQQPTHAPQQTTAHLWLLKGSVKLTYKNKETTN